MDGTIIGQGTFTQPSTAITQVVAVPSGIDWMYTYNKTAIDAGTDATGVKFYWQRGMPAAYAVEYRTVTTTGTLIKSVTTGGFTLYDPSGQTAGAQPILSNPIAFTAVSNATRPVVSTGTTSGLSVGSMVILSGTVTPQLDVYGHAFTVTSISAGVSFTLLSAAGALATAPGLAGGAGNYRIVNNDALFYPRRRVVVSISQATQAVVATSVPHGFTPGQEVRFSIPQNSGMTQLNAWNSGNNNVVAVTVASISATDLNVFTINLDTTGYTSFTYPTSAQVGAGASLPVVDPVGEDTGFALTSPTIQIPGVSSATLGSQIFNSNTGILADSTVNTGVLGMVLPTGADSPGGQANDVVFWVAGKSTYGGL